MPDPLSNEAVLALLLARAHQDADFRNAQAIGRYNLAHANWMLNKPVYEALKIKGFVAPVPEFEWEVSIDPVTTAPTVVQGKAPVCMVILDEPSPPASPEDPVGESYRIAQGYYRVLPGDKNPIGHVAVNARGKFRKEKHPILAVPTEVWAKQKPA